MRFNILGPLEVAGCNGKVRLGGPKQVRILVELLLQRNHPVLLDRLVNVVWRSNPPGSAAASVYTYVSRIRRSFSLVEPGAGDRISTGFNGYCLHVADGEVDVDLFRSMVDEARSQRNGAGLNRAASLLRRALVLWRGAALESVRCEHVERYAVSLEELRLIALEDRITVELELGRSVELVPELRQLVELHPFRERLSSALLLALYRSGCQAEAIGVFRRIRDRLIAELGVEPGEELQEAYRRVLLGSGSLSCGAAGYRSM